uniref:Cilia- and flagella-associated protein 58 central coiled coil domain-containing protein n=1 Tax=Amorphochlora amoebiformis TaxID=1561963 RepID=A0A7S0DU84_9EUKA
MVKLREADIHDLKKFIAEGEKKLKLQKSLYEQVRADRNFFSKKHVQSRDEIAEMKQKFKIMKHQIEQLKEEIQMKEIQLINAHFTRKQLTDEKKGKDRRLNQKNEVLETADKVLANQNDEIQNLRQTLEGAEFEQQRQRKIYEDVVQERDILAAQLIRRNDELALLYEKIRIQQSTLSKGEVQYRQRLKDIQMMKLQLTNVKREISIRNQEVENTEALKNELYNLQRELLQEKTKVKALSEELENPMNVHRWRQLEGSDPKRWELIQKIQTLQKRLIVKTEEAVEKDMLLQEKEKLYMELKNILARQPGPEVSEQLSIYQQNLKEKTRQMKAMAAELNMHQAQISEYRYEIERLSRELQDNKRKFFEQKRKDQIQKEVQRENQREELLLAQQQRFHLTHPKIAGGGFNLQATT